MARALWRGTGGVVGKIRDFLKRSSKGKGAPADAPTTTMPDNSATLASMPPARPRTAAPVRSAPERPSRPAPVGFMSGEGLEAPSLGAPDMAGEGDLDAPTLASVARDRSGSARESTPSASVPSFAPTWATDDVSEDLSPQVVGEVDSEASSSEDESSWESSEDEGLYVGERQGNWARSELPGKAANPDGEAVRTAAKWSPVAGLEGRSQREAKRFRRGDDYASEGHTYMAPSGAFDRERTKLFNDEERDAHELHASEGRLMRADGSAADTSGADATNLRGADKGRNIFALAPDADKGMRAFAADAAAETGASHQAALSAKRAGERSEFEHVHHSSFTAGGDVAAAGDMEVKDGWVKKISNNSGHYTPDKDSNIQAIEGLQGMGVNLDAARVESFDAVGTDEGNRRSHLARPYAAAKGDTDLLDTHQDAFAKIRERGAAQPSLGQPARKQVRRVRGEALSVPAMEIEAPDLGPELPTLALAESEGASDSSSESDSASEREVERGPERSPGVTTGAPSTDHYAFNLALLGDSESESESESDSSSESDSASEREVERGPERSPGVTTGAPSTDHYAFNLPSSWGDGGDRGLLSMSDSDSSSESEVEPEVGLDAAKEERLLASQAALERRKRERSKQAGYAGEVRGDYRQHEVGRETTWKREGAQSMGSRAPTEPAFQPNARFRGEEESYFLRTPGLPAEVAERTKHYDDDERAAHAVHAEDGLLTDARGAKVDTTGAQATSLRDTDAGRNIFAVDHDDRNGRRMFLADATKETLDSRAAAVGDHEARGAGTAARAEAEARLQDPAVRSRMEAGDTTDLDDLLPALDAAPEGPRPAYEHVHHSSFTGGQDVDAAGDMRVKEGYVQRISNTSGHYKPGESSNLQTLKALEKMGANLDATTVEHVAADDRDNLTKSEYQARAVLATGNDRALMDTHKSAFAQIREGGDDPQKRLRPTPKKTT